MKDVKPSPHEANADINARIARRVATLREQRALSLEALAQKSDVSRSMISLIERGESSATAVVLEKLATGLGVTLASLFEDDLATPSPVSKYASQVEWRDPQSGYIRRNVSPPNFASPIQLVHVELPAGARVAYETTARDRDVHEQIWVLEGRIEFTCGDEVFRLDAGDCLAVKIDRPTSFRNPARKVARYAVVIVSF